MLPENVKWEAVFQSIVDTWLPLIGMVVIISTVELTCNFSKICCK